MSTQRCEHHGEYESEEVAVGSVILTSACPECLRENEIFRADEKAAKEEAEERRKRWVFLSQSNIEQAYLSATLEAFQADTEEQQKGIRGVRRLLAGEVSKLVMTGKNGTGKTHLAVAALLERGAGRILTMYEITVQIRATYTPVASRTELEIVDDLARLPLLVIDEMGRTKGSEAEQNWLSYVLDKRHVRKLPTILISNKHVRKDCKEDKGCSDCLENYMGEDVMSRFSDGGLLLRFTGEDWRKRR